MSGFSLDIDVLDSYFAYIFWVLLALVIIYDIVNRKYQLWRRATVTAALFVCMVLFVSNFFIFNELQHRIHEEVEVASEQRSYLLHLNKKITATSDKDSAVTAKVKAEYENMAKELMRAKDKGMSDSFFQTIILLFISVFSFFLKHNVDAHKLKERQHIVLLEYLVIAYALVSLIQTLVLFEYNNSVSELAMYNLKADFEFVYSLLMTCWLSVITAAIFYYSAWILIIDKVNHGTIKND